MIAAYGFAGSVEIDALTNRGNAPARSLLQLPNPVIATWS